MTDDIISFYCTFRNINCYYTLGPNQSQDLVVSDGAQVRFGGADFPWTLFQSKIQGFNITGADGSGPQGGIPGSFWWSAHGQTTEQNQLLKPASQSTKVENLQLVF